MRFAASRARIDQMYEDELDGKIDGEFWMRKMNELAPEQESMLETERSSVSTQATAQSVLTGRKDF